MKRSILWIAIALLLGLVCFCGYRYYDAAIRPERQLDSAEQAQQEAIAHVRPPVGTETAPDSSSDPLAACEDYNEDTVGWITIPDTNIDLPIMQGEDNDFYLHNGVNGQYNYDLGCPFLDFRCQSDFSGFNSVVYGHNITKRRMFADISLFSDEAFMNSHPTGTLLLHDGPHTVTFFAYLTVESTSPLYQTVVLTEQDKTDYLEYLFSKAKITAGRHSPEDFDGSERLLLLSTCTYEFEEARGVLAGVIDWKSS